ncbi:gliding motility-associated C-terminal domain-containing protein [Crocinitomicaceae bacterium]|nr:gliding motility-associated C-terminal domain-containing protein [Crocinitomicaceae bacterium]
MRSALFILLLLIYCTGTLFAQLPVWPLVTGYPQSGSTNNTTSTTPHQYVDWTSANPSSIIIPSTGSNRIGPTQAGINGCNELEFFTLHNGEFNAATAALEVYTPAGTYLPLAGGDMNVSAGDFEVQIVRRPGNPNQWFLIYNLAPTSYPSGNPGYQSCYLAYSLIEVIGGTASYVLDGLGNPIQDKILDIGGTNYQYFSGKATSRTSVVVGYDHDIYVQRRTQGFGSASISSTFQIDRFSVSTQDNIVHTGSSSAVNGYSWNLMVGASPIELSPTENSLAVTARTQNNNQQETYLFDPANLTAAPNTIRISDLWIEFTAPPTGMTGLFHQASAFDFSNGTGVDWLRNFERKISGWEYSPNGDYLYFCGGGYVSGASQNITYLAQIDLNQTISGNHVVRLQVQQPNVAGTFNATSGVGDSWNSSNYTNLWERRGIGRLQSCYDGNLYFTKSSTEELFVIPNPDNPLPINMVPSDLDLSTPQTPNISLNGYAGFMPDQIDGYNYLYGAGNSTGQLLEAVTDSIVSGDTLAICAPSTVDVIADWGTSADYLWNTGDTSQQLSLSQAGTYTVDVYVNGCFITTDSVHVIGGNISVDLGPDSSFCNPGALLLDATTTGANYLWQDGSTQSTYQVTTTGNYWVTIDAGGCIASDTIQVTVLPGTNPQLGPDTTICDNNATIFYDVTEPGATYIWQDGSTNPTFTVTASGTYWVESSIGSCNAADTVSVIIAEQPDVDLGNDTTFCGPIEYVLDASCSNCLYDWQDGSTGPNLDVSSAGTYYVTVNNSGCVASDTVEILQYFAPEISINNIELCELGQELITLNASGSTYLWQDGTTGNNYLVNEPGVYSVIVTNFCGSDTVDFQAIPVECFCDMYVPNTYTPDGDEFNQEFRAYTDCALQYFEMEIFNRWGELIFVTYNINDVWDANYKGKPVQDGTYTWKLEYSFADLVPNEKIGHVSVIR